jgi:hypothetical protein
MGHQQMEEALITRCLLAAGLLASVASPALAANSFQNTCSEIRFAFSGNAPTLQATCLRANGTLNKTSLVLQGISNQNGKLTQGTGPSTFQTHCGNIQILLDNGPNVTLSAICRTTTGDYIATSLPLNNIGNKDGVLVQQ